MSLDFKNELNEITSSVETDFDVEKAKKKDKVGKITGNILSYIFLTVFAVISFLPFYWMIISSLKMEPEYRQINVTWFPKVIMWKNYGAVVNAKNGIFGQVLVNTIVVGLISTGLGLVITVLTAYALARMNFIGKNLLFTLMLGTMMIPGEMFTITNYVTVTKLGWNNTFTVLIVPFMVSIYYIYLLRNNFMQIPNTLYQAAKVDGLSDLGYLIKVMVPLTAPTLISITLLKFIGTWNSYIWPQLVNNNESWRMITNWVSGGFADTTGELYKGTGFSYGTSVSLDTLKMAAVCMVSMPLFFLFVFFRKYIMSGVSKSGIKG